MRSYRCFFLNRESAIADVEIIEAETDEEAVRRAESLLREKDAWFSGYEAWDRGGRMHRQLAEAP